MKKLVISRKLNIILYAVIFAVFLTCILMTPIAGDDFRYSMSFADGKAMTSAGQLFPSAAAHFATVDGRFVPALMAQALLMLPAWIYGILGAAMLTAIIFLVMRICAYVNRKRRPNNAILFATFALIWIAAPRIGATCFTVTGGVFYVMPILFGLLFLMPFIRYFLRGKSLADMRLLWLYIPLSLLLGASSMVTALAFIAIAVALLVVGRMCRAREIRPELAAMLICAAVGLVTVLASGAMWQGIFDGERLVSTVLAALVYVPVVLLAPIVLFILVYLRARKYSCEVEIRRLSLVLALGAAFCDIASIVCACNALSAALTTAVLLLAAIAILIPNAHIGLEHTSARVIATVGVGITVATVLIGMVDIGVSSGYMANNAELITDAAKVGESYVSVSDIPVLTKYSASFGGNYIDCESTDAEQNCAMADYYGVGEIIGVPYEWRD